MSVHYCQGEAHYGTLRYLHAHQDKGCSVETNIEEGEQVEEKACCLPQAPVEKTVKKFADKPCCQDELIKSNPSEHHLQQVYTPHFDFILPDYSWTEYAHFGVDLPVQQHEILAYYIEANAPPLYQLYCRLVFYA